jgi:hypothetical protein
MCLYGRHFLSYEVLLLPSPIHPSYSVLITFTLEVNAQVFVVRSKCTDFCSVLNQIIVILLFFWGLRLGEEFLPAQKQGGNTNNVYTCK